MSYPYHLSLHRYKLTFQLPENMDAQNFFGSKLRGILGSVLKETNPEILKVLYEKQALPKNHPAALHIGVTHYPSPFLITHLPYHNLKQNQVTFILTLLGAYHQYFSEIYRAFENFQVLKNISNEIQLLSVEKLKYNKTNLLKHSYENTYNDVKDMDIKTVEIRFRSPFIIARGKELITDFGFQTIYKNLHRRVALLSTVFGNSQEEVRELTDEAFSEKVHIARIEIDSKKIYRDPSDKKDYTKYGFSGTLTYKGDLKKYLPLLSFGQYTQIGSDTAFGLGKYELVYYED